MDRPTYRHKPIRSVASLCRALGEKEEFLRSLASRTGRLYRGPIPKPKKNGKGTRDVYDAKHPLKPLLQKINRVFFRNVDYPDYLQGSLAGRDPTTNALVHRNSRLLVSEDISKFFDHIDDDRVFSVWHGCFRFDEESSKLLTEITTMDGFVRQGAPTSSYLGNLAFWDVEGAVVTKLREQGFRYSRFVDDVAFSSQRPMSSDDVAWAIAQLYAMMGSRGFKPQRGKHEFQTSAKRVSIMRFGVNRDPSLSRKERSNIRGHLHKLEVMALRGALTQEFHSSLRSLQGRLSRLKRMHPKESADLKTRFDLLRNLASQEPTAVSAKSSNSTNNSSPQNQHNNAASSKGPSDAPWD